MASWGAAGRAALIGIVTGALLFGLFYLINLGSLNRDLPLAQAEVRSAFATGVLQDKDFLPSDVARGWNQYNDCLILWQVVDQRASASELAVSPLKQTPEGQSNYCVALRTFVTQGPPQGRTFYHRYIHGHTMLARYLLPVFGVAGIRELYRSVLAVIVACGVGVALTAIARRRRVAENLVFLILFLAFGRFFGLESFGQSLGHGPSDIVQLSYLLYLGVAAAREGIGRRTAIISAAVFGGMVAIFEFLTGGLHLGAATVIGALPFAMRSEDQQAPVWLNALVAFCAAAVTCFTLKYALAVAMFGADPVLGALVELRLFSGLGAGGVLQGRGLTDTAERLISGLSGLAAGMTLFAGSMVFVSIAGGAWGASRLLRSANLQSRRRAAALLLSNAAIWLLLILLSGHTITHFFVMGRTLAWTIGSGFALFALAALEEYPVRQKDRQE